MKIGIGFDVHRLVESRKLIIGGVDIPYEKGLLGHSDSDVLIHAIMDALLGAAGLGDIGVLFPDNDPSFKNVSSLKLLADVNQKILSKNLIIGNIDSIIIAQEPKMRPFIPEMINKISECLNIGQDLVSIKATTTEELGAIGRKEGIAAKAVVLMVGKNNDK